MKNRIILIVICLFLTVNCEKILRVDGLENNSYSPMKVGNSWTYAYADYDTFTVSSIGKKKTNNHEYCIFTSDGHPFNISDTTYYCENEQGDIMIYSPKSNKEIFRYYFGETDTSWQAGQYKYYMGKTEGKITIPFGDFRGKYNDLYVYS